MSGSLIDNASADVLAYVGSGDFFDAEHGGQNDGVRALRQPGSTLKPFVYGLALSQGYTPASVLSDLEVQFATHDGTYAPQNYDRRVHGPVRLRAALANSYNVPAVGLADALGAEQVLAVLRAAGLDALKESAHHYGIGVVLGDGEITLRQLAAAYAGLARGGTRVQLRDVLSTLDVHGVEHVAKPTLPGPRFLQEDVVALLTDIMADEAARAPAFGLRNALRLPFPVAAKTGTSHAHVDNWTVGFTKERTVAVWVGNFDGKPMHQVCGITGAGPIFRRVMERAMDGIKPEPLVDKKRFERVRICPLSGELASAACPTTMEEHFLAGTAPRHSCSMHRLVGYANEHCASVARNGVVLDVGSRFHAWAKAEGLAGGPWPDCMPEEHGFAPTLLQPLDGDEFLLEPGIPVESQGIPVKVLAGSQAQLELRADHGQVIPLRPPFTTQLSATPGPHVVELWEKGSHSPAVVAHYRVR